MTAILRTGLLSIVTGLVRATPFVKFVKPLTVRFELIVIGAEKLEVAWTVNVWLLPPFRKTFPLAVSAANVASDVKLLVALTSSVCAAVAPKAVVPCTVKLLALLLSNTFPVKVAAAVKMVVALTMSVCAAVAPKAVLPSTVKLLAVLLSNTFPVAVTVVKKAGAMKEDVALTVSVCVAVAPNAVLPSTVRLLAMVLRVILPVKVARP